MAALDERFRSSGGMAPPEYHQKIVVTEMSGLLSVSRHKETVGPRKVMETNWNILAVASDDDLIGWAADQPWAAAMMQCCQDPIWHSEGDVWTHTVNVCQQLPAIEGWDALDRMDQLILIFAALLHDSAKPITTRVDETDGRIRSPKHAVKGEMLARRILRELECPFFMREQICGLVRHHGKPWFLGEKNQPEIELAWLSWQVRLDLLFAIAMADFRGRVTTESNRSEQDLDWFRVFAEEYGCFRQPFPLQNETARFLLGRRQLSNLHYAPYEDHRCSVKLMCGLPGSGKDTWLGRHHSSLPVVSLDRLRYQMGVSPKGQQGRVVQAAREQCRVFLRTGQSFAINGTNTSRQIRKLWVDLLAQYDAYVEIVYLESTLEETLKQNHDRKKPVPASVIRKLADRSEPPGHLAGHRVQYWISDRLRTERECGG